MRNVLGQPQMGEPLYVLEREAAAVVTTAQPAVTVSAFDAALTRTVQRQRLKHWVPQDADGPE